MPPVVGDDGYLPRIRSSFDHADDMLIGAHTSAKNVGGTVMLSNVGDRINSILTLTRLLLIFQTFDTEKEGIEFLKNN